MTRFAALGDSVTLGVGDPVTGQGWRGWAALLAESLPEPDLHMLATNGACMADIERDQLPLALAVRPQVASVVFGINDTVRPGRDLDQISGSAERTIGALRSCGAQVLTMRLPDAGRMLRLPAPLARPLARRTHEINGVLDRVAKRFGTLHLDVAGLPEAYDRAMWAADRLHPNERGHRLLARCFHRLLADAGQPMGPPPPAEPAGRPPGTLAELAWLATKGTAWVLRRSTDLVPYLLAMAARDLFSRAEVADARVAAGGAVEPFPQGPGGLDVAAVVAQQPLPGRQVALVHGGVVADHGLLAAGVGHVPGEPG
jgi:lysophospholipase L1-like esterase